MKRFSKEELQEQAVKFMNAHNVSTFHATEDGNFFHPKDVNLANDHNNKNVRGEVFTFSAEQEPVEGPAQEQEPVEDATQEQEPVFENEPAPVNVAYNEDVERHGEPAPKPKPKSAKPKSKK